MANKPDKFGIKFWVLADVDTKYMLNAFPYLGKDETRPNDKSLSEFVVLRLMDPFLNKGLNVSCDNFFTSVSLAEQLQNYRTSLLGTMRTNEIEKSCRLVQEMLKMSCIQPIFCKTKRDTLLLFINVNQEKMFYF